MTIKELCQTQHVQMCHVCEDWQCSDNTNPIKNIIEVYNKYWHMDSLLSDLSRMNDIKDDDGAVTKFKSKIIFNLWQAIKTVVEKGG